MSRRRTKHRADLDPIALRSWDAARALGVSEEFFARRVAAQVPVIDFGKLKLYPVAALTRWAEENAEVPR